MSLPRVTAVRVGTHVAGRATYDKADQYERTNDGSLALFHGSREIARLAPGHWNSVELVFAEEPEETAILRDARDLAARNLALAKRKAELAGAEIHQVIVGSTEALAAAEKALQAAERQVA